jgi:hypothetical protein
MMRVEPGDKQLRFDAQIVPGQKTGIAMFLA